MPFTHSQRAGPDREVRISLRAQLGHARLLREDGHHRDRTAGGRHARHSATSPDPAAIERLSKDAIDHSIMHTTCVATRLEGGHANNALPQRATAVVNCRILPGHSTEEVRQVLIRVLADPRITVRYIDDNGQVQDKASDRKGYPPPPLNPLIMKPLERW
jgi:acetylornithine deacetylase/succinyl-diaminopimelate desuccinylase-like protein